MKAALRTWLTFASGDATCAACVDDGGGPLGVVIVSGGTELACGAHAGMARIAAELATRGACVLRFDRPGVGDSTGTDPGFEGSASVLVDAVRALRSACPSVERIVMTGNCDAATALLLADERLRAASPVAAHVLTNVWLGGGGGDTLPPPSAIRSRYRAKLASPREWWRLVSGGVDLGKLRAGLSAAAKPAAPTDLADRLAAAAERVATPVTVLLADGDATAVAFADARARPPLRSATARFEVRSYPSRSHSFADEADRALLIDAILDAGSR